LLPDTCSWGALLAPGDTSVAVNDAEVRPVALAVNVVAPLLELFAVIVTFCAVAKFDGVNVSEVGDAVSPVLPLAVMETVTFEDGAEDSDTPTVPVCPSVMACEAGDTIIVGVVLAGTSVAEMVAAVYPLALAVNVVTPVPLELAVTVTVCAVEKFDGVNVSEVGDSVSPVLPLAAMVTVSFEVGACDSASENVPVLPWVTFRLVGVALMVPAGGGGVVDPDGVQVTDAGAVLVPL
jgi:hypothetical protein